MFQRTKLKDRLYGEMFWEEWDEYEAYWFAPMKTDSGDKFDLFIRADSPADFMTVGTTHSTYKKLLENADSIRDEMIAEIMENSRRVLKKKRQRKSAGEALKKNLRLYSMKIYSDLSATVEFVGNYDEEPEEIFYAVLETDGTLIEAGIEEL